MSCSRTKCAEQATLNPSNAFSVRQNNSLRSLYNKSSKNRREALSASHPCGYNAGQRHPGKWDTIKFWTKINQSMLTMPSEKQHKYWKVLVILGWLSVVHTCHCTTIEGNNTSCYSTWYMVHNVWDGFLRLPWNSSLKVSFFASQRKHAVYTLVISFSAAAL